MEANQCAFWTTLDASPGITIEERPEGMRFTTGVQSAICNGIMSPRMPGDDAVIKAELNYFTERGLPMTWTIGPSDTPADIGERLERLGVPRTAVNPGMAVDLASLREEDGPRGFEIEIVRDAEGFRVFNEIVCEAFEIPAFTEFAQLFTDAGSGQNGSIASFLGRLDGEPVGASRVVMTHGLAGVYTVATRASARGKGVGRALTLAACLFGKARGYRVGVLQATDLGHPVYLRMGFRDYCEFSDYTWTPA